jgi:hypothetical protein
MEKQRNVASHGNFLEQWSHAPLSLFNEQWSHAPLLQCLFFFVEKSMKKFYFFFPNNTNAVS